MQESTSNDFPVAGTSLPPGLIIGPFIVPVNRAIEHVQSPLAKKVLYGRLCTLRQFHVRLFGRHGGLPVARGSHAVAATIMLSVSPAAPTVHGRASGLKSAFRFAEPVACAVQAVFV